MPRFDQHCLVCPWEDEIVVRWDEHPICPACGGSTERLWRSSAAVIRDTIPGGVVIENLDHLPVTVYSQSQLKREMAQRGLQPMVRHVGLQGSDKSPQTSRWI